MTTTTSLNATKLPKLSDVAMVILRNAAQREDRLVLPVPSSVTTSPNVVERTIKGLISRALVEEKSAKLHDIVWRTDEQDHHFTLVITEAGIREIDGGPFTTEVASERSSSRTKPVPRARKGKSSRGTVNSSRATSKSQRKGESKFIKTRNNSKANQILALLKRSSGATLTEIMKATGWQAHSIRGFLSGTVKKRMGLKLTSEQAEGKDRRYKIPAKA